MDAGEMTDKGSINQRAVLRGRVNLVKELYASPPSRAGCDCGRIEHGGTENAARGKLERCLAH